MPAPVLSRGTTGRAYIWPPNKVPPDIQVPSVTTVINEYAKPWLAPWQSKAAAEFAADNIEELSTMPRDAVVDVVNRAAKRISDASMGRGTKIHEAVDAFVNGEAPAPEDLERLPEITAAITFMQDWVKDILWHEVTIFNVTYQYAGTADMIVVLKKAPYAGQVAILDWKSGKRLYKEVALQLSAYANGEFIADVENGEQVDMPQIDIGLAVHLQNGRYSARPIELRPEIFKAFVALRTMTKYRAFIEPDVFGKAMKGSSIEVIADGEEE